MISQDGNATKIGTNLNLQD